MKIWFWDCVDKYMESKEKRSSMELMVKIFAIIGVVTFFTILIVGVICVFKARANANVPSKTILEIDFSKGIVEVKSDRLIDRFGVGARDLLQLRDVVTSLATAAKDKRIKGVVAHIAGEPLSYANAQEIRDAVLSFRKSGKFAYAFAETFGEMGPGNTDYYLASAFDSISLQPSGNLGITGILLETPFLKGTLEKLDIKPQLGSRKEYKTARNMFTEEEYTAAHREMSMSIIKSIQERFVSDVSKERNIGKDSIGTLISEGPFTASQALNTGLIDRLEYRDELYDRMRHMTGEKVSFLYLSKYVRSIRQTAKQKKTIALIYADGMIAQGQSGRNQMSGNSVAGAQTIAAAFRAAVRDKNVGAIVFRINSPGGSYIGSDIIWRETVLARKAGKPFVVTMGAVAGSGGYFVAMNANKIIANPSTITGSIGVVGGKFVSGGLFNKLGVTFDHVATDSNATMWSSSMEYSKEQWGHIDRSLDIIYNDFVKKVASGRNLPLEKVEQVAKGRVYTGSEALKLGLVDTLGGFSEAFSSAKNLMGIPADQQVRIKIFPKPQQFWKRLFERGPKNSDDAEAAFLFGNESVFKSNIPKSLQMLIGLLHEKGNLSMESMVFY
jgi:protease IV